MNKYVGNSGNERLSSNKESRGSGLHDVKELYEVINKEQTNSKRHVKQVKTLKKILITFVVVSSQM